MKMSQDEFEHRRREYEKVVLQSIRQILLDPQKQIDRPRTDTGKVWVDEVSLDTSEPEHDIVILFRDLDRPECKFGFRMKALEALDVLDQASSPFFSLMDAAEIHAGVVWANFEEEIYAIGYGLPKTCASAEITWIPK